MNHLLVCKPFIQTKDHCKQKTAHQAWEEAHHLKYRMNRVACVSGVVKCIVRNSDNAFQLSVHAAVLLINHKELENLLVIFEWCLKSS